MEDKLTILAVDDHQMFIDGIKALLRKEARFDIAYEANSGQEALDLIAANTDSIDLVMTDISMPGMTGVELTKAIKEQYPELKVLVLSMYDDSEIVNEIVMAEAEGYILKNTGKQELVAALERISDNGTFYSDHIVEVMMRSMKQEKKKEEVSAVLTERELEIVQLICSEKSSEEIAGELYISKRTVDTHRRNILGKIGVNTLVGLIKFAYKSGIYSME